MSNQRKNNRAHPKKLPRAVLTSRPEADAPSVRRKKARMVAKFIKERGVTKPPTRKVGL